MRIGINAKILAFRITGIGRYTLSLINAMADRGHELFIYYPVDVDIRYVSDENIHVRASNCKTRIGIKIWEQVVLPVWANRDKVDILWSPSHHLPLFIPKNIHRVVTIHDLVWKNMGKTMRFENRLSEALLMPLSIKIADQIITVSLQTADDMERNFPDCKNKVNVVYSGVTPLEVNGCCSEAFLATNRPFILFVGTIEPRKNIDRLLTAFSILPEKIRKQYTLVIAGSGERGLSIIEEAIRKKGIADVVEVLGYVTDDQLSYLYRNAKLLVFPSLYEGFGLPLLEAMSVGTPVLTSSVSSMPEVVGDSGYLVDPYNVNSIAEGIERILEDKDLRDRLGELGKQRAKEFSWENSAAATLSVFEKAIELKK